MSFPYDIPVFTVAFSFNVAIRH